MFSPVLKANAKRKKQWKQWPCFGKEDLGWEDLGHVHGIPIMPTQSEELQQQFQREKKMQEANSFETTSFWLWEFRRLKKKTSWTTLLKLALSQRGSERNHKTPRSFDPMKNKISALFPSIILLILHTHLSNLTTDLWSTAALWKDICHPWWHPQPIHTAVAHLWQSPALCQLCTHQDLDLYRTFVYFTPILHLTQGPNLSQGTLAALQLECYW